MNYMDPQTNPVLSQPPPFTPRAPLFNRISIIIGVIVLLLLIISSVYYLGLKQRSQQKQVITASPTQTQNIIPTATTYLRPTQTLKIPDETADWKTYTSTMDFIFLYPPTWFVTEEGSSQFPNLRVQNYNPQTAPGRGYDPLQDKGKYLLTVNRFPVGNETITNLDQLIAKLPKEGDQAYYMGDPAGQIRITASEKKEINGFPTITITIRYSKLPNTEETKTYILDKNGNVIVVQYGLDVTNGKEILDKILSTFRFLQQTTTDVLIESPKANTTITTPLKITGKINSNWMFEGVFPIQLQDNNRKLIAQIQGKEVIPGSWQKEGMIEFSAELIFSTPTPNGYLVIKSSNPSGLPEKAKIFEIPIIFAAK